MSQRSEAGRLRAGAELGLDMAWKWIRISLESRTVSWYKNEIVRADVSNCMRQCLKFSVLNVHIPVYMGSKGKERGGNLGFS